MIKVEVILRPNWRGDDSENPWSKSYVRSISNLKKAIWADVWIEEFDEWCNLNKGYLGDVLKDSKNKGPDALKLYLKAGYRNVSDVVWWDSNGIRFIWENKAERGMFMLKYSGRKSKRMQKVY